jgi:Mrp family chromosome partitioning ATPase
MAAQNTTLAIVGQADRGRRGSDPAPAPLAAYDISAGWRPEPTLVAAARRDLRDDLLPLSRGRCVVLAVAGPSSARDQKSRVAAELALALSERGACRVLVVEGDFERPAVHRNLRAMPGFSSGFSQQIHARTRSANAPGWLVTRCSPSLDVLAEGAVRSPGLMASKQFEDCFTELRNHYDFIIVDGPPLSADTECRVLDDVSDGLLLVAKREDDPGLQASVFSTKSWSKLITTA